MTSNHVDAIKQPELGKVQSESTSSTTVGDLYRLKLSQAKQFLELAEDRSQPNELRIHLRAKACALEICANDLAHCIAQFGDGELRMFADEEKMEAAAEMTCHGGNPWARGLSAIFTESKKATAEPSSPRRSV